MAVVSPRSRRPTGAFTMQTYQHVLPGMQASAARSTERLAKPAPPAQSGTGERRGEPPEEDRLNRGNTPHNSEGPGP
jgi:hypothetical protein